MDALQFILSNLPLVGRLTLEHLVIVFASVGLAIGTGVPLGIAISQNEHAARWVLGIAAIVMTIPSAALFGLMIPPLSLLGHGIGTVPAVAALFLYAQLPIIRNTATAIGSGDPSLREAARGMGMTAGQRLWKVELPNAVPLIMAGVRIAVVVNIGIAAVATYIGAGGLGTLINRGIAQSDTRQLIAGALVVSVIAVAADYLLLWLQRALTPKGLRTPASLHSKKAVA